MYANSIFFLSLQFSRRKIYKNSPKTGEFWKRMFNFVEIYIKWPPICSNESKVSEANRVF